MERAGVAEVPLDRCGRADWHGPRHHGNPEDALQRSSRHPSVADDLHGDAVDLEGLFAGDLTDEDILGRCYEHIAGGDSTLRTRAVDHGGRADEAGLPPSG